jgi:hypothetical protein
MKFKDLKKEAQENAVDTYIARMRELGSRK